MDEAVEIEYVPWVCPKCGKGEGEDIRARARVIIRCTCGHTSWSS